MGPAPVAPVMDSGLIVTDARLKNPLYRPQVDRNKVHAKMYTKQVNMR